MKKGKVFLSAVALLITAGSAFAYKVAHRFDSGDTWYQNGSSGCVQDTTCKQGTGSGGACQLAVQHYTASGCANVVGATHHVND